MLVTAALLRRRDRLCRGQRAARYLLATSEREGGVAGPDCEAESGASHVDRSNAVAVGFVGRRCFSSSSHSSSASSRHAFAKPRLQPPSIARLPEALKKAHDLVSSPSSSSSSPSAERSSTSSFGGARRLGPLAAALSGSLASRSRSLGRGGVAAAAWEQRIDEEGEEEEEGDDDNDEGGFFDDSDDDGSDDINRTRKGVLTLDLVTGKTARVRSRDGVPLGQADEEALGWRSGGGKKKKKEKKAPTPTSLSSSSPKTQLSLFPRPAAPSYEGDATAAAYALVRAPASYSAALHALLALRESPSWGPSRDKRHARPPPLRVLDFGAGTGAAFLAAAAAFGGGRIGEVVAVERSSAMARAGRAVVESLVAAEEEEEDEGNDAGVESSSSSDDDDDEGDDGEEGEDELLPHFSAPRRVRWVRTLEEATKAPIPGGGDESLHYWRRKREAAAAATKKNDDGDGNESASSQLFDLVLASFSLGESPDPPSELETVESLWKRVAPGGALVVVEPGTPAGSLSVRAARDRVLQLGSSESLKQSHVAAPCLHDSACPLSASPSLRTWCHFGQRLERSRSQRVAAASAAAATGRRGRWWRKGEEREKGKGNGKGKGGENDAADDLLQQPLRNPSSLSVSSHTDVRFSYVALVAAPRPEKENRKLGARGGERSSPPLDGGSGDATREKKNSPPGGKGASEDAVVLARVTRAPRPRSGHVLVGACFDPAGAAAELSLPSPPPPSFGASVVTVAASARPKGAYRAARGAPWGGVVSLPASAVAKAAAAAAEKAVPSS